MHLYQPKNIKINLPYSLEENEKMVCVSFILQIMALFVCTEALLSARN